MAKQNSTVATFNDHTSAESAVLTIRLPKTEKAKPAKIKVKG